MQIRTFDERHHQILAALILEMVEHLNDTGMAQLREEPRLDLEALGVTRVLDVLDRDGAACLDIPGTIDGTHGPA